MVKRCLKCFQLYHGRCVNCWHARMSVVLLVLQLGFVTASSLFIVAVALAVGAR